MRTSFMHGCSLCALDASFTVECRMRILWISCICYWSSRSGQATLAGLGADGRAPTGSAADCQLRSVERLVHLMLRGASARRAALGQHQAVCGRQIDRLPQHAEGRLGIVLCRGAVVRPGYSSQDFPSRRITSPLEQARAAYAPVMMAHKQLDTNWA